LSGIYPDRNARDTDAPTYHLMIQIFVVRYASY
jgi:hypothetical protein